MCLRVTLPLSAQGIVTVIIVLALAEELLGGAKSFAIKEQPLLGKTITVD